MRARKAILPDAPRVQELIAMFAESGALLPRSLPELCENIRDFCVVEDEAGNVVGCGALHLYGTHLAEIRSIAVDPPAQGQGAARRVVKALLREAAHQHVSGVCLFTRIPDFFAKCGFAVADLNDLPDKMYHDCLNCPRLNNCDEVAMVKGELPKMTILQQARMFARPLKVAATP